VAEYDQEMADGFRLQGPFELADQSARVGLQLLIKVRLQLLIIERLSCKIECITARPVGVVLGVHPEGFHDLLVHGEGAQACKSLITSTPLSFPVYGVGRTQSCGCHPSSIGSVIGWLWQVGLVNQHVSPPTSLCHSAPRAYDSRRCCMGSRKKIGT